jgi:hypothetical protein
LYSNFYILSQILSCDDILQVQDSDAFSDRTMAYLRRVHTPITEIYFLLNAAIISSKGNFPDEEYPMSDTITKLVSCVTLLALVGTVSGAGYIAAGQAGIISQSAGTGISCHSENSIISGDRCAHCRDTIEAKCSGLNWWDHLWCTWYQSDVCSLTDCFM